MPRSTRLRRAFAVPVILAILVGLPAGFVLAGGQTFSDVPPSHLFYNDIEAVAAAGVTSGCTATTYCPNANVTRGQMAAFMNRLGALSAGKTPVVNARTSQSTDGWSLGCPVNTTWSQGLCFDNATRGTAAGIYAASDACAALNTGLFVPGHRWHLPTANELLSAHRVAGLNLSDGSVNAEWASDMWIDSDDGWSGLQVYETVIVVPISLSQAASGADSSPYRCATYPVSWDGLSIIFEGNLTDSPDSAGSTEAQTQASGD